jgi:tRNA nucleotidyltransferase (CCA-adding enzyme)
MAEKASDDEDVRFVKRDDLLDRLAALPEGAALLDATAGEHGVHLVGGAVRDLLLEREPLDLDLVVEGPAAPVARRLADRLGGGVDAEHDRFGTVSVRAGGRRYDLVQARAESYAAPGALPDVRPGTLADDLRRRDFTVHAIALALGVPGGESRKRGRLTAVEHAFDDLDARRLRVMHDGSFRDDATRLLRLARYEVRLGFSTEPHTAELAAAAVAGGAVAAVSGQRLGAELRLALREPEPLATLERIGALGVDRAIHPGLGLDRGLTERALALLPPDGRADLVLLAGFTRGIGAEELQGLLTRLGFTSGDARAAVSLAGELPSLADRLARAEGPAAIAALLSQSTVEEAALAGALGAEDQARQWIGGLRDVRLEIDGGDLIAAGIPEGPAVGFGLARALAAKLEGQARTREEEFAAAVLAAREHPAA